LPLAVLAEPVDHSQMDHGQLEMDHSHMEHHHAAVPEVRDDVKPSDGSVYWLEGTWTTQQGTPMTLKSLTGKPVLLLMAYTTCKQACPMLIEDVKRTQSKLTPAERAGLQVLFVSIDPKNDTPEVMKAFQAKIPSAKEWTFLNGSPDQVLELASVLGVRYRKVGDMYVHSNKISVLSKTGEIAYQAIGLNAPEADTVTAIRKVLK
jgi:protein SCO1/2